MIIAPVSGSSEQKCFIFYAHRNFTSFLLQAITILELKQSCLGNSRKFYANSSWMLDTDSSVTIFSPFFSRKVIWQGSPLVSIIIRSIMSKLTVQSSKVIKLSIQLRGMAYSKAISSKSFFELSSSRLDKHYSVGPNPMFDSPSVTTTLLYFLKLHLVQKMVHFLG